MSDPTASRPDHGLTRRRALQLAAAGAVPFVLGTPDRAPGQAPASPVPGIRKPLPGAWFIPRGTNAEMRWTAMRDAGYLTPNPRFFVRNHTATPLIDARTYRLEVFGSGLRDAAGRSFSPADLRRLPRHTVTAFIECAGNGRSLFERQQGTRAAGTAWTLGAVGVARWTGVRLRDVLAAAGLSPSAVDVMPIGLDAPVTAADGTDQGRVRRPLPVGKALDDALLAWEMNGSRLPYDHGYPLRLVVPGWVGIASIKWVGAIEVADHELFSPWNTTSYRLVGDAYPDEPVLTDQPLKSAFELREGAVLPSGRAVRLYGRSWSGRARPAAVEVSADGGATWTAASFVGPNLPDAWARWTVVVRPGPPGETALLARATDETGVTQPDTVPFNRDGYQFWAVARHPISVR